MNKMSDIKLRGLARDPQEQRCLVMILTRPVTDNELRELHERLRPLVEELPLLMEDWEIEFCSDG